MRALRPLTVLAIGGFLLAVPWLLPAYPQTVVTQVLIFSLFAMSIDILAGVAGRTPLCHGAIFGTAAYVAVGHTDSQGAFDHNMDLSRRRAEAIAAELVKSHGIAQGRLRTAGVGFLAPVGPNATEDGRALNRRVELVAP